MAKRSGKRKGGTKVVIGGKAPRGRAGGLEPAKPIGNGKPPKVKAKEKEAPPVITSQDELDIARAREILRQPDDPKNPTTSPVMKLQRYMNIGYTSACDLVDIIAKEDGHPPRKPVSEVEAKPQRATDKIPVNPASDEPTSEEIERLRHLPPEAVKSILANQRRVRLATIAEMETKEVHKIAKGELEAAQSEQSAIIVRWFGPKSDAPLFDSVDKPAAAGVVGAAAVEDDAWKLVPVENLTIEDEKSGNRKPFPAGLLETLKENGLHTAGDISEAQAKGTGWHRKLKGIGDAKAAQIEDAMTFLFAERSRALKNATKDEDTTQSESGALRAQLHYEATGEEPHNVDATEPDAEWPGDEPPDSGDSDEEPSDGTSPDNEDSPNKHPADLEAEEDEEGR